MGRAEWHVVICRNGRSARAAEAAAALSCVEEVYAPVRVVKMVFGHRTVERPNPWLGPLALVRWSGDDPHAWHDVADVKDVTGILGGWPPLTVSDAAVRRFSDTIQVIESKEQVILFPPCAVGDWVRFTHLEIFYQVLGVCLWAAAGVVGVRVMILGRDQVIQVPYESVETVPSTVTRQYGRRR